jgi:hypothetical protein
MKKSNNSNPLKTFNDSYDKKVDSFNKNLKKFQGDIGGSQVGTVNDYDKYVQNKNIISRYDNMNKKIENDIRDKYIKNITGQDTTEKKQFNKEYPNPTFIDPNTGGIKKEKSGGQTKSKKKK